MMKTDINVDEAAKRAIGLLLRSTCIQVTIALSRHDGRTQAVTTAIVDQLRNENIATEDEGNPSFVAGVHTVVEDAVHDAFLQIQEHKYGSVSVEIERSGSDIVHTRTWLKEHFRQKQATKYVARRRAG